jgi:hypothetical protein
MFEKFEMSATATICSYLVRVEHSTRLKHIVSLAAASG